MPQTRWWPANSIINLDYFICPNAVFQYHSSGFPFLRSTFPSSIMERSKINRPRAETLEALKHGTIRSCPNHPLIVYHPSKPVSSLDLPSDFYMKSIRDIDKWFLREEIRNYDVTLRFVPNVGFVFEMRNVLEPYLAVRQKYNRSIRNVVDFFDEVRDNAKRVARRLSGIRSPDPVMAKYCSGDVKLCSQGKDRLIFLPRFTNPHYRHHRPPHCVLEFSDLELRHLQIDLFDMVKSFTDISRYGFSMTFSMGRWIQSQNAHIKIWFDEPYLVRKLRIKHQNHVSSQIRP